MIRQLGSHRVTVRRAVLGAVLGAALTSTLLAGCGDDDKPATSTNPSKTTTASKTTDAASNDPYGTQAAATDGTAAGAGAASSGAAVTIEGFAFKLPASVQAGATVSITNDDSATHTFTADDGSFGVSVGGGKTATVTAPAAGTHKVHCEIHPSMTGELVVN